MKSFKKIIEQMKGITLVGLVITIILLLILAGVAINLAIGEKGIFNQSKLAAEKYKDAQNNEEEQLQIAANAMLGNISGNRDENGNSSISNNYSTDEQVVGTWIDGKPLYQKTLTTTTTIPTSASWVNITIPDSNIETLIDIELSAHSGDMMLTAAKADVIMINSTTVQIQQRQSASLTFTIDGITLRYTKKSNVSTTE